ncbi:hypothetical protein [Rubrimonas cliftonensis]|uniref:Uncharacterized protein n=1 Tax=Rubrimonas cliftonensis TaxID=89524 RepID=A0A1H4BTD7_9RHOB|nr:hypothetical protein [Rubrimonas cliftonensis]SEA51446.1 hypothetical protein SAMN05444370_10636 [Rubrimonas cliftonensis]
MPKFDLEAGSGGGEGPSRLAESIVARAPRDLMFVMQFVGETQYQVLKYFQDLVIRELEARGIRREDHALLQIFIDMHATEMRDFVFSGVSLSRPFRIEEMERLMGDSSRVMRSDIWDALRNHIESVERKFLADADGLPDQLGAIEADAERRVRR